MTGHIFIYGEIGKRLGEVSLKNVTEQIDPNASDYVLHIASPGGDVFEGFGIYNKLLNTGKPIVTHVESLTASIATLISFAGEKIIMNRTTQFMVHPPTVSETGGDAKELRNVANQLDQIQSLLMDVAARRAARNGKPLSPEKLKELYDNETWLTSDKALELGFVDDVQDAIKAVARIDLKNLKMEKNENAITAFFRNLFGLKRFRNEFTETLEDGTAVVVMSEDGDWTGKQIVTQTGESLPPGDYKLASGKVITVGDNSTIAEVKDTPAAPEDKQNQPEDMSKIKELEDKLAASESARQTAEANLAVATESNKQVTAKFENKLKAIEDRLAAEDEEKKKIYGQMPSFKNKGPVQADADPKFDPMGEDALAFYQSRNLAN